MLRLWAHRLWKASAEKSNGSGKQTESSRGRQAHGRPLPWAADAEGFVSAKCLGLAALPHTVRRSRQGSLRRKPNRKLVPAWPRREPRRSNATQNKDRGRVTPPFCGRPWSRARDPETERSRGAEKIVPNGREARHRTGRRGFGSAFPFCAPAFFCSRIPLQFRPLSARQLGPLR